MGDLSDVRTVEACEDAIGRFETLLEFEPDVIACDLHPRYNATVVAEKLAVERGLPLVRVQHHYAHVAACMAENDVADPVIGVSFDGTGYGTDGTVWGGEILLSDYHGFERVGHIASFAQVGGDLSSREGWRIAVAMLRASCCGSDEEALGLVGRLGICDPAEARVVLAMAARGVNTVASTSCGRLFDAVSAVLGIRHASTFEGEAATQLQFAAERCPESDRPASALPGELLRTGEGDGLVLATDGFFADLVRRRLDGEDVEALAYRFHLGLSELVVAACERVRAERGVATVALTGGCYQNTLLLDLSVRQLEARGFAVLTHSLVPPNDGGVALGQAVVAAQRMRDGRIG